MTLDITDIDLTRLADLIRESGRPVHINRLARTAVSTWLEHEAQKRQYAPGATYNAGEHIEFNGRSATITSVQPGHNPQQGKFQILTLTLADGINKQLAAGIAGAAKVDRTEVTPEQVQKQLHENGLYWRTSVQDKLAADNQFITFQDEQGDQWFLAELLPTVTKDDLRLVWPIFRTTAHAFLAAVPTEKLVATVLGLEKDGSDEYELFTFALNATLQEYRDLQYVAGAGWMLAEQWRQLEERPSLVGPRKANIIPEATDEGEEEGTTRLPAAETSEPATDPISDMELWRRQRRNEVPFTLRASHYYYHWLPLSQNLRQLFPPRPCRVTIFHRFDDQETSFTAVVNPEQKRILGERAMYDAFCQNGIYPGAKMIVSHRGTDYDYDLRTRPIEGEQSAIVRRIALNSDEQLEYWDDTEKLRYQVDGDVFVADARWEELAALFQQADEAGQGIFGLMFEQCQEWQKERGTSLIVTADELFDAIHFGPRMTSKATIAYELWRRLAFKLLGQGRYQFCPEKGDRTRAHGLTGHQPSTAAPQPTARDGKSKSLTLLEKKLFLPQLGFSAASIWAALMADDEQRLTLKAAVLAYQAHPFREKMLFLREIAHERIRHLLAAERLAELNLADFNQQVWQLGTVTYQGHRARIDSDEVENLLKDMAMVDVEKAYAAGDLLLSGNQTWGSGSGVYGAPLRSKTVDQKIELLRQTLHYLLYAAAEDERRMARTIQESNGFGINVVSGLLHAIYPLRHILYNTRSVEMLNSLGIEWPANWRKNAGAYLVYRDFMQRLQSEFNFVNSTDVDWFVYGWGGWQIGNETPAGSEPETEQQTAQEPLFIPTKSGQLMATGLVPIGPLYEGMNEREEPAFPATGYFIFQQKPVSDYDDQTGLVYNWRQGIPGSKQIDIGARFIYYRPGEQVFFGCGRIEEVKTSKDEDGRTIFDGQIEDYEQWKPPLPLTHSLANQLSFIRTGRLAIGQAGIRKINKKDFETIRAAYHYMQGGQYIAESNRNEKKVKENVPLSPQDEFSRMEELIWENLLNETIYTPSGKANKITKIAKSGLMVKTEKGKAEVTWIWIRQVYDKLCQLGEIDRATVQKGKHRVGGGFRSAFIFGLLARFNHVSGQNKPLARLTYHSPHEEIQLLPVGFSPAGSALIEENDRPTEIKETAAEVLDRHRIEFSVMKELITAQLLGETIYTPDGQAKIITSVANFGLMVKTKKNEDEVTWIWIRQIYDKLRLLGEIEETTVQKGKHWVGGGFCAPFIFGLLARFNHISAKNMPHARLVYFPLQKEISLLPLGFSPASASLLKKSETETWTEERILSQFQSIRPWRRGNKIARHKPLLLIYALARCKQGGPRLIPYSQIDYDLTELLVRFNPDSKSTHTEYPFWRLQNDGLWEIPGANQLATRQNNTDAKKSELLRYNITGGFPQPLYDAIRQNPVLIEKVMVSLLDKFFPALQHAAIRKAVGLITPTETASQDSTSLRPDEPKQFDEEKHVGNLTNTNESSFTQLPMDLGLDD